MTVSSTTKEKYLPTMVAPCELAAHWNYNQVRSIWRSVLTKDFLKENGYDPKELKYRKRLPEDLTRAIYKRYGIESLLI